MGGFFGNLLGAAADHPVDAFNIGTGLLPTIMSMGDRFRLQNDPALNGIFQNRLSQYNQSMGGGGPMVDANGGYGQFGQFSNGQNMSPYQGSFFNTINMLNNPNNPAAAYQQNLLGMSGMRAPGLTDTTAGLSAFMGRPSQFGGQQQQPPGMVGAQLPGGTVQANSPSQGGGQPGFQPVTTQGGPGGYWWSQHFGGGQGNPSNRQQEGAGMGGVRSNSLNANGLGMAPNGGLQQTPGQQQGGGGASPFQQLMGNPTGGQGSVTQGALANPSMPLGQNVQTALGNHTGGTTSALGSIMQQGGAGTPQSVQNALGTPNAGRTGLESNVNQQALSGPGSLTNAVVRDPRAAVTGLNGAIQQNALSGPGSLTGQIVGNPQSLNNRVQDQLYQRGAGQIDKQNKDLQRQLMEQANASGRFTGGGLDKAMLESSMGALGQKADLRNNIGIEAARTNFSDLLNANQAQQGDLARQSGNLLNAGAFQQGINQNQFQNLLSGAGLQQQGGRDQFGNLLNAAQFGQNNMNNQWQQGQQTAQLGLQNQQQQLNNALSAGNFQQNILNNQFQQGQQTAGLELGAQNQQFGQNMQSAGLEQQDMQRRFGNLLNANQFQLGAEGQLANQQMGQNQLQQQQYQQQFGNQMGLANNLFNAGQAGEQRNLGLWNNLTGMADQSQNYQNQLLQQILAQRQNMLAPGAIQPAPSINVGSGGGGGGGGGNSWLPQVAQLAGQFAGGFM